MRRVVITGIGIVSPIGIDKDQVSDSLRRGRSGITFSEEYRPQLSQRVHGIRTSSWRPS